MQTLWRRNGFCSQELLQGAAVNMSRRAAIAGGLVALAASSALAGCSDDPEFEAGPVLTPRTSPAPQPHSDIHDALDGAHELVAAGQRLDVGLLTRFYARHDFEPVWTARQAEAGSLTEAVLRARDHGLDPELFHASLLQGDATLTPLARELLMSDAFLSYADALARGAVPIERRRNDEVLAPEPVDVAAVLDEAIDRGDAGAAIEALAPSTPTYRVLRQELQRYRVGALVGNKAAANRARTIEVNLERQRWLPRPLPADRAWVNVADEQLVLYRADQPVFSTRVVVGEDVQHNQSPEFRATIEASFYNPPWVVPADIANAEILPKLDRDPAYLTRNKMIMLDNGDVEQLPGPEAGLGLIMFDMPNRFDVYLHDTPERNIFLRENRRISHGCIRVQNPREFAARLSDQPIDAINQGIAKGDTTRNDLPTPVPVFVVYQTAFADTAGTLQFRPDFYNRDAAIWQLLQERSPGRVLAVQADRRPAPPRFL